MTSLEARRDEILERIEAACARAGRDPASVSLVAVSKGVPAERLPRGAGWILGENRVDELLDKQRALGGGIRWHFVGTLQRNKVRPVVGRVELIHSVDSIRLAASIGRRATQDGLVQQVLIQVNVSGEASKHGAAPLGAEALAAEAAALEGISVRGFMTIPQAGEPDRARAAFAALRAIRDGCDVPGATELSMGMSADFELAVEEGATLVRVGTAIFGPRPP